MRLFTYNRIIFLAMILLGICFTKTSHAKGGRNAIRDSDFAINIYGGFAKSMHSGSQLTRSISGLIGLSYGIGAEFRMTGTVSLMVDVIHSMKAFELTASSSDVESVRLAYLNVPVCIRYQFIPEFAMYAGPQLVSLLISGEFARNGVSMADKHEYLNDYGMVVGAWVGFAPTKNLMLGLNLRYTHGFTDIQNDAIPANSIYTRSVDMMSTITILFR